MIKTSNYHHNRKNPGFRRFHHLRHHAVFPVETFGFSSASFSCAISRFFIKTHLAFFIFSGMKSLCIEYLFDFMHCIFIFESELDLNAP